MRTHKLRAHVAALMLLAPAAATFVAAPVAAQQQTSIIQSLAVNADHGLSAGSTLRFELGARPGASDARLVLPDVNIVVPLRERSAGQYSGSYVVRQGDKIDPTKLISARVTHGQQTLTRSFNFPPAFQQLAQNNAPAAAPEIERFVVRGASRIEPGRELRFRLRGAPGGQAQVSIPGVERGITLNEVRPGVYEGSYTVRQRDELESFRRAVATLRTGNQQASARVVLEDSDDQRYAGDRSLPQITDLTPPPGSRSDDRGRVEITARLRDEGSGIDPASMRLRLNGSDVTAHARLEGGELRYRPDLTPGHYSVHLSVRDRAGNLTSKNWSFDIVGHDRDRVGQGPVPLEVTSHTHNGTFDPDTVVVLTGRTAPHATVTIRADAALNLGGVVGVTQPVLEQTFQADANGYFRIHLAPPMGQILPASRYEVRLTATNGQTTTEERLTLHRRS